MDDPPIAPEPRPVTAAGVGPLVDRVRKLLEQQLDRNLSLTELAGQVGLSRCQLARGFRDRVGSPPHTYHLRIRLESARSALHGSRPIATIAFEHGFCDQSHFHRHFKRAFGIPPGRYRRARRGAAGPMAPELRGQSHRTDRVASWS